MIQKLEQKITTLYQYGSFKPDIPVYLKDYLNPNF